MTSHQFKTLNGTEVTIEFLTAATASSPIYIVSYKAVDQSSPILFAATADDVKIMLSELDQHPKSAMGKDATKLHRGGGIGERIAQDRLRRASPIDRSNYALDSIGGVRLPALPTLPFLSGASGSVTGSSSSLSGSSDVSIRPFKAASLSSQAHLPSPATTNHATKSDSFDRIKRWDVIDETDSDGGSDTPKHIDSDEKPRADTSKLEKLMAVSVAMAALSEQRSYQRADVDGFAATNPAFHMGTPLPCAPSLPTQIQSVKKTSPLVEALRQQQRRESPIPNFKNAGPILPHIKTVAGSLALPSPTFKPPCEHKSSSPFVDAPSSITGGEVQEHSRNHYEQPWEEHFKLMKEYLQKHGDCLVPLNSKKYQHLAQWTKRQRHQYSRLQRGEHSAMTNYRIEKLNSIGFVWQAQNACWYERYRELEDFHRANGHCKVPTRFPKNKPLGAWVKCQRTQYRKWQRGAHSNMNQERVDRLNALGFLWEGR